MAVRIISRAEWGARKPKRTVQSVTWSSRVGVAFHYSQGNPNATPRDLQDYAMDTLDYADTHYNFFVDRQGRAYEGRGWLVVAAHAGGQNTPWIGVCFIGRDGDVTDAALATMRDLWDEANRLKGSQLRYSGHGQLPGQSTSCPGDKIKLWIARGIPRPDGVPGTPEEEDMIARYDPSGAKTETARYLQHKLKQLEPTALPKFGADGGYGDETAEWVSRLLTGGPGKEVNGEWFAKLDEMILDKRLNELVIPSPTLPESVTLTIPSTSVTARLSAS